VVGRVEQVFRSSNKHGKSKRWRWRIGTCRNSDAVRASAVVVCSDHTVRDRSLSGARPNDMGICSRRHFLLTICSLQLVSADTLIRIHTPAFDHIVWLNCHICIYIYIYICTTLFVQTKSRIFSFFFL